jgi:hypothetical protein
MGAVQPSLGIFLPPRTDRAEDVPASITLLGGRT